MSHTPRPFQSSTFRTAVLIAYYAARILGQRAGIGWA